MAAFKKGHRKLGGRKKGSTNKVPGALKDMILEALSLEGGVDYLRRQARKRPQVFIPLLKGVLPMTISGDGAAVEIRVKTFPGCK